MKKSDLVTRVATRASLSRPVADAAVNALLTAIANARANGEAVTLARFGTFPPKTRPRLGKAAIHAQGKAPLANGSILTLHAFAKLSTMTRPIRQRPNPHTSEVLAITANPCLTAHSGGSWRGARWAPRRGIPAQRSGASARVPGSVFREVAGDGPTCTPAHVPLDPGAWVASAIASGTARLFRAPSLARVPGAARVQARGSAQSRSPDRRAQAPPRLALSPRAPIRGSRSVRRRGETQVPGGTLRCPPAVSRRALHRRARWRGPPWQSHARPALRGDSPPVARLRQLSTNYVDFHFFPRPK